MKRLQRILVFVLSLCIVNAGMIQTVHAGMVSTEDVARLSASGQTESGHARLTNALARADVRAEMERLGVDQVLASKRVATLTDAEAAKLADQIDSAPAGGIIGAILLVFFVLLITDILGFTKVFPFTKSVR